MANIKGINDVSRRTVYMVTGVIVMLAIGMAAVTHADDRGKRAERPEREGRGMFVNMLAKFNLWNDLRVHVDEDNVRVNGATVTATSTSGFTATSSTQALSFIVQTDASTKFNIKGEGTGSLADIAVGDFVNFRGTLVSGTTTSTWTLNATHVEEKTWNLKPFKWPKPFPTTTAHVKATTTAQLRMDSLERVIERLQEVIDQMKSRFGL